MSITSDEIPGEMRRYFEILQDPLSLTILSCLMKEHGTISTLAQMVNRSKSEIKEHLNTFVTMGLVIRWPVVMPSEGTLTWFYSTPPSLIQTILGECDSIGKNTSIVSAELATIADHTAKQMKEYLKRSQSSLVILGGAGDGMVFELAYQSLSVGREDQEGMAGVESKRDIIIPGSYRGVTRISKPHAVITRVFPDWYIEDCNSSGGTYLNNEMLKPFTRYHIHNQDIIVLGSGPKAARIRAFIGEDQFCQVSDLKHLPIHSMGRA